MKITKRRLKRIIREEYTRLKRQGLINEMVGKGYMINDAMGGPEDQSFPAGTTVQQAADQMVSDMQADYPGCLEELQAMNLSVQDLENLAFSMDDELGECVGDAIEYMDIEGSGNFESRSCVTALHQAIYGRRAMAESRRRRRVLREYVEKVRELVDQGLSKNKIFHKIKKQERDAGRYADFQEIYDIIDDVQRGRM